MGRNLAAARLAKGLTQDDLAGGASVSRATIVQIESGEGDPKLSTLADLALALGTSPTMLLMGAEDMNALVDVLNHPEQVTAVDDVVDQDSAAAAADSPRAVKRAAEVGIAVGAASGFAAGVAAGAAIGTILLPGIGTAVGAAFGAALTRWGKHDEAAQPNANRKSRPPR